MWGCLCVRFPRIGHVKLCGAACASVSPESDTQGGRIKPTCKLVWVRKAATAASSLLHGLWAEQRCPPHANTGERNGIAKTENGGRPGGGERGHGTESRYAIDRYQRGGACVRPSVRRCRVEESAADSACADETRAGAVQSACRRGDVCRGVRRRFLRRWLPSRFGHVDAVRRRNAVRRGHVRFEYGRLFSVCDAGRIHGDRVVAASQGSSGRQPRCGAWFSWWSFDDVRCDAGNYGRTA